ncbi:hypothetical protein GLP14_13030 [Photobacterium carnosum]|uniref:TrlF family AAA-like ATPase n=1 Tax=Photobacterium carnosum TaxID=2023717 RepID=UPI001E5F1CD0|nr:PHP domain-containing protein [Photobacterium carnosum]MCD9523740.1 hypothetical protein [Photobacterium carnosum]
MSYLGIQWYKCDFHLHTTASACFADKVISAEQWVDKAVEAGLDCVAVTDHNTGMMIDQIKEEAEKKGLVVFPGVELTCDTSKIHLLIIFDTSYTSANIDDFLISCGIKRNLFGTSDAYTIKSIFDIIEKVKEETIQPIIIPAHIDEFNGINNLSNATLNRLKNSNDINGYQISNPILYNKLISDEEKLSKLIEKYGDNIDNSLMMSWKKGGDIFFHDDKVAKLTFSDNPESDNSSKHGLNGIGKQYTWIKMDENPSLEGIRQALNSPKFRVKTYYESPSLPFSEPELWFEKITISDSKINNKNSDIELNFNPQMNTIIGGRGSGKSSILQFIRGVFNKKVEIEHLDDIYKEHASFYKRYNNKDKKGVIAPSTVISITMVRNGIKYTVKASKITDSSNQQIEILKHLSNNKFESITDENFIDFFSFDQYSQKQIYEISKNTNSLRSYIDRAINEISEVDEIVLEKENEYIKISSEIKYINDLVNSKAKLLTEDKDLEEQLNELEKSDIQELLTEKKYLYNKKSSLDDYCQSIKNYHDKIEVFFDKLQKPVCSAEIELLNEDIFTIINNVSGELDVQINNIKESVLNIGGVNRKLISSIESLSLINDIEKNENKIEEECVRLGGGTDDILIKFNTINRMRSKIKEKVLSIDQKNKKLDELTTKLDEIKKEHLKAINKKTELRIFFIESNIIDEKIKIEIKSFRDKADFVYKLRSIIQKETGFDEEIEKFVDFIFNGKVSIKLQEFKRKFKLYKENKTWFGGRFYNVLCKLNDNQFYKVELLYPDDDINVQYKPNDSSPFKSLSVASAGQKTTAILTFILSYGEKPLLLDQPEDDLDNRLVYDLIVDRLRKAKEKRQIIVVTHNANIPVNGDSELIISMNSNSKYVEKKYHGSIDVADIKNEVCDIMEGTEEAFNQRSIRYKNIS